MPAEAVKTAMRPLSRPGKKNCPPTPNARSSLHCSGLRLCIFVLQRRREECVIWRLCITGYLRVIRYLRITGDLRIIWQLRVTGRLRIIRQFRVTGYLCIIRQYRG